MLYKGRIAELNKMVVSDPSYGEDVWCRYERNDFPKRKDWAVQMKVDHKEETVEGFDLSGVEFSLMICLPELQKVCRFGDDGSFFCPMAVKVGNPKEVGMDTACVALGINERADMIKAAKDEWKPPFALDTMTDGFFGEVSEGTYNGKVVLVVASGYLDDDTGHTVQDVVDYLTDAFEIKDLELVTGKKIGLNRQIDDANAKKENSFEDRLKDAYERSAQTGKNRAGDVGSGSDEGPGELGSGKEKNMGRKSVKGGKEELER